MTRRVVILGSTGSIGTQAFDVIERHREKFDVVGIAAGSSNPGLVAAQAAQFEVPAVAVSTEKAAVEVSRALSDLGWSATVTWGDDAVAELAALPCDVVLNGLAGAAGLVPTLAALRSGSTLALANKESLIIGGPLVKALAGPGQIVPVDSEHSAIAQALRGGTPDELARIILTASGGPFRGRTRAELQDVTVEQAMAHPTWAMGPLVTINSSTLVNKGLELIEAHLLFDVPMDRIDVVVHPQSIVHSMVEFIDGSTLAQASPPDMRLPIALGLAWPHRLAGVAPHCEWDHQAAWTFEPVDEVTFPAISLARLAGSTGGSAPAVFNAADEAAVGEFMAGRCGYLDIVDTIAVVLSEHLAGFGSGPGGTLVPGNEMTLEDVFTCDSWARQRVVELVGGK